MLGIRSIGVTLSAVACASLRLRGIDCRRASVRPPATPTTAGWRQAPRLRQWIRPLASDGFLIVDEGPGISGSSFLAVAEALEHSGVEGGRIHMIGSRAADPASLRAPNAARRWARYRFHVMHTAPLPPAGAGESLSGGAWRRHFHPDGTPPASWPSLEPARYLARDEQSIFWF